MTTVMGGGASMVSTVATVTVGGAASMAGQALQMVNKQRNPIED